MRDGASIARKGPPTIGLWALAAASARYPPESERLTCDDVSDGDAALRPTLVPFLDRDGLTKERIGAGLNWQMRRWVELAPQVFAEAPIGLPTRVVGLAHRISYIDGGSPGGRLAAAVGDPDRRNAADGIVGPSPRSVQSRARLMRDAFASAHRRVRDVVGTGAIHHGAIRAGRA